MVVLPLINKILQLFVFMIAGYVLVRAGVVKSSDSTALSKICLFLLLPSAVINAFDFDLTREAMLKLLVAYLSAIAIHLLFFLADAVYARRVTRDPVERASALYPNAGNIIIPIVTSVMGEEWVIYTTAFISVQIVFLWTRGIRLFAPEEKTNFKKMLFNPNIIAICAGLVLLLSGIRLGSFAKDVFSSLGGMVGTVGMLVAGMLAATVDPKSLKSVGIWRAVIARMLVYPVIALFVVKLFSFIPLEGIESVLLVSYLSAIAPAASTVMQFAQIKNSDPDKAAAVNIITTALCCVTMPLFVLLYQGV